MKIELPQKEFKYEPLKIEIFLGAPISITHPWVHGDSLIIELYLKKFLKQDYFLLPSKTVIDFDYHKLPIYFKEFFYSSVSIFNNNIMKSTTIYKRFEDKYEPKTKRKKIPLGSGYYKSFAMKMVYVITDKILFYVKGDYNEISELLSDLQGIGSETRIGWGEVRKINIEKIDNDYSVYKDNKAMRPIPVKFLKNYSEVAILTYKPPYWDISNIELCAVPFSEVSFDREMEKYFFGS